MRVLLIGVGTVVAMELLAILTRDGIHWGMVEMEPGVHRAT